MSEISAIRKQIAALQAQAERLTKHETAGAISKIKEMMQKFGVTIEHLSGAGPRVKATRNATPKRAGAGQPKYRDPKSGATWTGFGRAPAWMAKSKNRAKFLIDQGAETPPAPPAEKAAASKKTAKKIAKKVPSKAKHVVTKKAVAATPVAKRAAAKGSAKRASAKKSAPSTASAKTPKKTAALRKRVAKASTESAAVPEVASGETAA